MPDYTLPAIAEGPDGLTLRVRAVPGASRERIVGVLGEALKVAVAAPAEKGKANEALLGVVARELGLRRSAVSLEAGAGSRDKRLLLRGVARGELERRLRERLAR